MGDIERGLGTPRQGRGIGFQQRPLVGRAHIERVGCEHGGDDLPGLAGPAAAAQQRGLEPERARLRGVGRERPVEQREGIGDPPIGGGDLGAGGIRGRTEAPFQSALPKASSASRGRPARRSVTPSR